MKLPTCVGCSLPVLELTGQFEKLDSYYLEDDGPPRDTAGYWHTRCLVDSAYGASWYAARLRNHVEVRRFEAIDEVPSWTILRDPRAKETIALSRTGELLHLAVRNGKPRIVEGGAVFPLSDEYNLELEDHALIGDIQDRLVSAGTFSVADLVDRLSIANRVMHPVALERAVLRFDRSLKGEWAPSFVSAQVAYGLFVPADLLPYVRRADARG